MKPTAGPGKVEPRELLQELIDLRTAAILSYSSKGKWHVAKVLLCDLGANRISARLSADTNPRPLNIQVEQPVGMSLKYGYGKVIFDTKITGFEPCADNPTAAVVLLAVPDKIEIVQRRSYFRVNIPAGLKVNVLLWHRGQKNDAADPEEDNYRQGRLMDLSAGGAQVAVDLPPRPDFRKGQFIGVRFTPLPYETPLVFNAQIRNILPTADGKKQCMGLQIVGLEASAEGQAVLARLVGIVERYYHINRSSAKQNDIHPAASSTG